MSFQMSCFLKQLLNFYEFYPLLLGLLKLSFFFLWGISFIGIVSDTQSSSDSSTYFAGEQVILNITALNNVEQDSITSGYILCRGGQVILFFFIFGLF